MERNNNLKEYYHQSINNNMSRSSMSDSKNMKISVENNKGNEEDYINEFCWPPRSYTCSFCKREFRSAQALGGHMNVHRKERAKLRQSSPPREYHHHGQFTSTLLNLNPKPNPNPNPCCFSSSISTKLHSPFTLIAPLSSSSRSTSCGYNAVIEPLSTGSGLAKTSEFGKSANGVGFTQKYVCEKSTTSSEKVAADESNVRLELEIGLLGHDSKGDLDLELRLGCA